MMEKNSVRFCGLVALIMIVLSATTLHAGEKTSLSKGQNVYVPVYSQIYSKKAGQPFLLAVTLSIRNVDPRHQITITTVNYYDTHGKVLKKHLENPLVLEPFATTEYVIDRADKAGGSGANFIVTWKSNVAVNPPIIESIMIGTQSQQGISFTSRGEEIIMD